MPLLLGRDLLAIYLQDHLAGATAGVELARSALASNEGTAVGELLASLAVELDADRSELEGMMAAVGVGPDRLKVTLAWAGEKAARLKLNGRITEYSPLSRLLELEGLIVAVSAKRAAWVALRRLAPEEPRLDAARLDALAERAERQLRQLELHHAEAAAEALRER